MGNTTTRETGVPLSYGQAVEDSELMLAYASQKGLDISADNAKSINRSREECEQEKKHPDPNGTKISASV
jgi:hypothetical protein